MEKVWILIARKLSGEASEEEIRELENLQKQHPEINYYLEVVSAWWNISGRYDKEEAEKAYDKLRQRMESESSKPGPVRSE